jgi:DNA-binding NarL/FixJ family response regulator
MLKALKMIHSGGADSPRPPHPRPVDRRARLVVSAGAVIDAPPAAADASAAAQAGPDAAPVPIASDPALTAAAALLERAGYRIVPAGERQDAEVADDEPAERPDPSGVQLSDREAEVLALLAEGASNKLIARRLGVSVHTAKFHVASILSKLGAANRTDAIGIAMRTGLVLI